MKKQSEIKVIVAEPMKEAYVTTIKNELSELQAVVGGYIEVLPFTSEDEVCIVCNEEGKINGLPLNRGLSDPEGKLYEIIAGTMFIVGDDYEAGEFVSLTDEQIEKYLNQFLKPEVFYRINDEILSTKVEENFWEV